jgi:nicotinamide-nucleotide amidase
MDIKDLAKDVMARAKAHGLTLVTAESCTAGRLAAVLAEAPGAGKHLHGGFITYTKDMKHHVLGVDARLLREKSAVCAEVAEAMAAGALHASPADVAVAITGVAGPEPDEDGNPVGLVFCASAKRGAGQRPAVKILCTETSKEMILTVAMRQALLILSEACAAPRAAATGNGGDQADAGVQPADP